MARSIPRPAATGNGMLVVMTALRSVSAEMIRLLEQAPYRFARTMADCPHSYTLRKDWNARSHPVGRELGWSQEEGEAAFTRVCAEMHPMMRRKFFDDPRKPEEEGWFNWYFDMNGYRYFYVDHPPAGEWTLINRAPRRYRSAFAGDPQTYDDGFGQPQAAEPIREFHRQAAPAGRVLDVGCGTGRTVDYCHKALSAEPGLYVGIDPSPGMLAWFALKHPAFRTRLIRTTLEEYETAERFDVILMANVGRQLLEPGYPLDEKLRSLAAPGGRAIVWNGESVREVR